VNGGCFVFKKGDVAAYRLNEFASTSIEAATARLTDQARALSSILRAAGLTCAVSFSLELVHGMWTFEAPTR
jgi:transglutaminase-like putative cysteine protease